MYSFDDFKKSDFSLMILNDNYIIFESKSGALTPLVEFLKSIRFLNNPNDFSKKNSKIIIYDKYIGRAAALLMTKLNPVKVYTPVISKFGREIFEQYHIDFQADKEVTYLMGIASDDMCRWEKLTVGKSPDEFWAMLNE